ncbi:MAG: glycosyltransferase, partial [Planctomycetes bacterium]|nr:glycosyltransferase [Planctomycetota bacterium]
RRMMRVAFPNIEQSIVRHQRTRPSRVCFLIDRLSRAGTETQLLALIRSLDRSRVLPHLVLLDGLDDESRALEPDDCPILRLGIRSLLGGSTIPSLRQLGRFWRKHRIELLQTYFLDSTYFGVPFARLCGIKKIVRVRNNLGYWMTDRHRRLGRWMGRFADVTLTNSDDGRQAIIDTEQQSPEKVVVIENGVDVERFPIGRPPETGRTNVQVGAVANLRPVKNIDGLVRVTALLRNKHPQLRFEVAGEGEQRSELERLIGTNDAVRLSGPVTDVPAFLARQDIAVLCSHSEGMSNALLEYMAAGRAIVATDVGANGRLVRDRIDGLIVPPKDDAALAAAIAWLTEHPEAARQMGSSARERVASQYSRVALVKRFEDFFDELLSSRR